MGDQKKWQVEKQSRLVVVKKEAKTKKRKVAMAKAFEFGINFRKSALYLIKKKHSGINLFGITFLSMEGHNIPDPNDESLMVSVGANEADGDESDEVDDSASFEDA